MAYSYVQYVGNGATTSFSIPFQYISTDHIEVRLNGVLQVSGYSFPSASSVQFDVAPGVDVVVEVRRVTPKDVRLVDFQNGSILNEASLDLSADQGFFAVQETLDDGEAALKLGSDGTYDAGNHRIKNVASPTAGADAVNKDYVDTQMIPYVDAASASATAAAGSASAADTAKTAAQAAQASAELIFDTFDDKYLGSKAADPTLDNDGDPLADGAMYFNTTTNVLKVYDLGTTTWLTIPSQTLAALTDIAITGLANNDTLVYNSGTSKWNNKTPAQLMAIIGAAAEISTQSIWIPAGALQPRTTNGPATATVESTTNKVMRKLLDFDAATAEYAQFAVRMPKGSNEGGGLTIQFEWESTNTGNVVWAARALALSDDDVIDTAFGTAQSVTDGVTAVGDKMQSAWTATITPGNSWAEGDIVIIEAYRDAANGSDTLAVDARLWGISARYITASMNDA